jgi:tRNA(Ile2) C34 agmatinyltransferase TiaS
MFENSSGKPIRMRGIVRHDASLPTPGARYFPVGRVSLHMPEVCPHCGEPVESIRKTPDDGRPHEVWRCGDCEEEWRHPEETVMNRDLDFSASGDQIERRDADTDLNW